MVLKLSHQHLPRFPGGLHPHLGQDLHLGQRDVTKRRHKVNNHNMNGCGTLVEFYRSSEVDGVAAIKVIRIYVIYLLICYL